MDKWIFLLNGSEISLDLFNYNDIRFRIGRDKDYWGYMRSSSVDKLTFLKADALLVKSYFEENGVNSEDTFEILKLNVQAGKYETYQSGVIDYYSYTEVFDKDGNLEKLEVDLVDSSEQQKLKTREGLDLRVGRNESVEGDTISTINSVDVLFNARPIRNEGFFGIAEAYIGVPITDNELNNREITIPTQSSENNITFLKESAKGANNVGLHTNLLYEEIALVEHAETSDTNITLDFDIDFSYESFAASTNAIKLKLQVFQFDGVTFTFQSETTIQSKNELVGSNSDNFSGTLLFDKDPFLVYRLCVEVRASLINFTLYESTIDYSYDDSIDSSTHKAFLIYEAFQSLLEQIADTTNIFYSDFFGRTDLGYASDGVGSGVAVTNGLFLRNAVFSDDTEVYLEANFKDLYDTMTSIYGLAMWWDGEKINIEKRSDAFGSNVVELQPENITRELFNTLLYTDIKVGNKQIRYENVNGTNEHNTTLQFSSPLRVKSNSLNLVTKYNTDYLGVELARRLSFATDDNVDTKYDDKVFIVKVRKNDDEDWITTLGLTGGYTSVSGIILPSYAGNLDFSPKRMLLNNADLLTAAMWKNQSDSLRFEKSENLAALVTQKTGEPSPIEELSDVDYSDMTEGEFVPMLWKFEVAESDLWKIISNQQDVFEFVNGCDTIQGYLWEADIQNDLGKITLIEKR